MELSTTKERIIRIINNLSYLLGKFLSEKLLHLQTIREIAEQFIEGWLECTISTPNNPLLTQI